MPNACAGRPPLSNAGGSSSQASVSGDGRHAAFSDPSHASAGPGSSFPGHAQAHRSGGGVGLPSPTLVRTAGSDSDPRETRKETHAERVFRLRRMEVRREEAAPLAMNILR